MENSPRTGRNCDAVHCRTCAWTGPGYADRPGARATRRKRVRPAWSSCARKQVGCAAACARCACARARHLRLQDCAHLQRVREERVARHARLRQLQPAEHLQPRACLAQRDLDTKQFHSRRDARRRPVRTWSSTAIAYSECTWCSWRSISCRLAQILPLSRLLRHWPAQLYRSGCEHASEAMCSWRWCLSAAISCRYVRDKLTISSFCAADRLSCFCTHNGGASECCVRVLCWNNSP